MILVLVSTPLSVARAGLSQKQAEKTIRWLYALSINASRKNALEYAQCHQVRIPCCHQGIHDWFWAKLVIEELSVLKSTLMLICNGKKILHIGHLSSPKMTITIMK